MKDIKRLEHAVEVAGFQLVALAQHDLPTLRAAVFSRHG
jgi:hypothetical protein